MKIPDLITIGGIDYTIIKTDEILIVDGKECRGLINYLTREIKISTKYEDNNKQENKLLVFFHEILHGIQYDRQINMEDDIEAIIEQFARGLFEVFKSMRGLNDKCESCSD